MKVRARARSDEGTSLVIVLIIVTVLAMVTGVVLSQLDTSLRTTLALRDQAGSVYNADGAAQVAISQLVNNNFNGASGACNTTDANLALPNFYPPANGLSASASSSAYVVCTHDSSNTNGGATQANTSPGSALLTLDPTLTDVGIYSSVNAGAVKVRGAIFANSAISAPGGLVNVWSPPSGSTSTTYNIARGRCTPTTNNVNQGVWVANSAYGSTTCNYGTADTRGQDPGTLTPHGASYNSPAAPTGNATVTPSSTACGNAKYQTVTPGRFSGATALATLNGLSGCGNGVVWFQPGTYYFDLPGIWNVPSVYLVGGTFNTTYADPTKNPNSWSDPTQACFAPGTSGATTSTGVEFVFGGSSQVGVNNSANPGTHMTICASNSPNGPPIAVYGLKTALGGSFPVAVESSCTPSGTGYTGCALISTGNSPKSTLTIQGTTYAPKAVIDVVLNNSSQKIFYWGLIAYGIEFSGTGSADVANPIVDVPDQAANPTPTPQTDYLTVYICPGAGSCSTSGTLALKVKVTLAAGTRTATVLSWSTQG